MIVTKRLHYFILPDQNKLVAFSSSTEHKVLARVLQWLAIRNIHHIMLSKTALGQQLVFTGSLQSSISVETMQTH
jgi:hypothetical protein